MNTYGQTKCPKCGEPNRIYRPAYMLKGAVWDEAICFCGNYYFHTDVLNKEEDK